jgi:hypothetical protein
MQTTDGGKIDVMNKSFDRFVVAFRWDAFLESSDGCVKRVEMETMFFFLAGCRCVSRGDMTGDFHLICKTFQEHMRNESALIYFLKSGLHRGVHVWVNGRQSE